MLKPYEMTSIIITGPNALQEIVIKEIHGMKVLHIISHSKNELADIGNPMDDAGMISELFVKARALISELGIKKKEHEHEIKKGMGEIGSNIQKLASELDYCKEDIKRIDQQISINISQRQEMEILRGIDIPVEFFSEYEHLNYYVGHVRDEVAINSIRKILLKLTENFMLAHAPFGNCQTLVIFIDSKFKGVLDILQKHSFSNLGFSNKHDLKGTFAQNIARIDDEISELKSQKANAHCQIKKLGEKYCDFLLSAEEFLGEQLQKSEAPLMFAVTKTSFLVKGWVPTRILNASIDRLNEATKNKIHIHCEPAKKTDNVPVKLKNLKYAKPFEFFMDLYTMPAYRELDPTFFVFLTFPLLFGFMLGDIGYGIVTMICAIALKKIMPKARYFMDILLFASIATILFGFIFGEFFGYEQIGVVHLPHLLSRSHEINGLFYLAVAIGFVHINLGLAIGFVNELKFHGFMHAFFAKISWFIFEIGFIAVMIPVLKLAGFSYLWGILAIAVSVVLLLVGEGARGPIEIPGLLSNMLSYARLMAIGLSSVKLAEVINESAGDMFHLGGLWIIAGVLILLIGHLVNIGLGLLGSFLHSLRLHYVEFFTKFFHGGAKRYSPFGARKTQF